MFVSTERESKPRRAELLLLPCLVLLSMSSVSNVNAFTLPSTGTTMNSGVRTFGLSQQLHLKPNKEGEEELREQIARKNAEMDLKNEAQYAVLEGADIAVDVDVAEENSMSSLPSAPDTDSDFMARKIERITKTRAYPLFLLEKAANIVDELLADVAQATSNADVQLGSSSVGSNGNDGTTTTREKIVLLGTGWGAAAFLKGIDADKFDVTVVSPRNFFLFTPMLAGASVGTVEYRSITEPVREINNKANYLEATATNIDPDTNTVECESVVCDGNSCTIQDFAIQYDRLIITVGAQTNTFGIPGVREHCCFLKSVEDARRIRTSIVNCFERANLPNLTDEQRRNILTFAVIGAGPTGIEFASELRDFVEQDGPKYYPQLLRHVRIKIIEASSSVLAPFDKSLQDAAVERLTRTVSLVDNPGVADLLPAQFELTQLLVDSGVAEVKEDVVKLVNGDEIPYGLSVWAAGNGPLPITLQLIESLTEGQEQHQPTARGRVAVDPWLRAHGGKGKVLALGDCSCNPDNQLPATAQVASQQGEYLARLFSSCDLTMTDDASSSPPKYYHATDGAAPKKKLADYVTGFAINDFDYAAPFQFLNLGILAYTGGGSALAQLQITPGAEGSVKGKGKIGFGLWRSVYLSKQVSWRNRFLVSTDWVKTQIFGRDITRA